jgi:hypothetical protein
MNLSTVDKSAWEEVLRLLGHRITSGEPAKVFCTTCNDTMQYEVFKFKDHPGELIGYATVVRIMREKGIDDWRQMEHVSWAQRCKPCYDRFENKHVQLVKQLAGADDKIEQGDIKQKLKVLWGRA